jgi:superfamily II DNA or RNA helicase
MKELPNFRIVILTGSVKKKERNEIMERAKNKEIDILLATQLAREGLDIPHLNRLFLTFPKKSPSSVQQEVGRIMRPSDGKIDAVVYDFFDHQNGILRSQFNKRQSIYRDLKMKTEFIEPAVPRPTERYEKFIQPHTSYEKEGYYAGDINYVESSY